MQVSVEGRCVWLQVLKWEGFLGPAFVSPYTGGGELLQAMKKGLANRVLMHKVRIVPESGNRKS
jgi:hypothetical protein